MRWRKAEIRQGIARLPFDLVIHENMGEDFTTDGFSIELAGSDDTLHLRGFTLGPAPIARNDDVDVEYVELTNGYSEGGLTSRDPAMIELYGAVRILLVSAGANVVNTINDYF